MTETVALETECKTVPTLLFIIQQNWKYLLSWTSDEWRCSAGYPSQPNCLKCSAGKIL